MTIAVVTNAPERSLEADHVCELLLCGRDAELHTLAREGLAGKSRLVSDVPVGGPATAHAIVAWARSYTSDA